DAGAQPRARHEPGRGDPRCSPGEPDGTRLRDREGKADGAAHAAVARCRVRYRDVTCQRQMSSRHAQPSRPSTTAHVTQPKRNGCHMGPKPCSSQSQLKWNENLSGVTRRSTAPTRYAM